jgi:hypothetical protein
MARQLCAVVLMLSVVQVGQAARILLLCSGVHTTSNKLEVIAIGEELLSRGHEVYINTAIEV